MADVLLNTRCAASLGSFVEGQKLRMLLREVITPDTALLKRRRSAMVRSTARTGSP